MARRALAAAKEKLLPRSRVSRGPCVMCGQITRICPRRNRLQLPLGESKRRHSAGCSVFDQVSNLTFVAASQAAAVDQCRGPISAFSALAVATLTELFELLFGLAEIRTLSSWNLSTSRDRCKSGCAGEPDIGRPLPPFGATALEPASLIA